MTDKYADLRAALDPDVSEIAFRRVATKETIADLLGDAEYYERQYKYLKNRDNGTPPAPLFSAMGMDEPVFPSAQSQEQEQ